MRCTAARPGFGGVRVRNVPVPPAHVVALVLAVPAERWWRWPIVPRRLTGRRARRARVVSAAAGAAAVVAGAAVAARSVAAAADVPLDDPPVLVVDGPYAVTRNPMYGAWVLVHAGVAFLVGSGWALATLSAAFLAVDREVRREEALLARRFGVSYARYRARVPRYAPRCLPRGVPRAARPPPAAAPRP
ncbi:isoprenylcysteine carboxylmethyltransferase family protein [Actinotalea sp. AC32]|nr:isoprenylcysteine carboxylmethyltransferase family protein [Actinotalea sp. AC32]